MCYPVVSPYILPVIILLNLAMRKKPTTFWIFQILHRQYILFLHSCQLLQSNSPPHKNYKTVVDDGRNNVVVGKCTWIIKYNGCIQNRILMISTLKRLMDENHVRFICNYMYSEIHRYSEIVIVTCKRNIEF